ncbi:MAG TPA: ATP-binding protein [Vicinamibacterales bacterium]|nr:ATP-binding protein [Vicinamibacterales bacterium]
MARPLRQQIPVVTALLVIAVLTALFFASRATYDEEIEHLRSETLAMTSVVVAYLERNLETADAVATVVIEDPAVRRLDARAATNVLRPLLQGRNAVIRNAVLADASGRIVAWAVPPVPDVEGQVAPDWLAGVASAGRRSIGPLLGDADDRTHVVVMGYPIADAGNQAVGMLGVVVHLESLESVLAGIPLPGGSVITISDENGTVVARSFDAGRYVGRPVEGSLDAARPLRRIPPSDVRTGMDGVERVFGNVIVERGPWLAGVGIPTSVAAARTGPIFRRNVSITLGALAAILGLSLYFSRSWLAAMDEVARTAERVANGDLSPLEPRDLGAVELNQLRGSIAGMINNLREAREAVSAQMSEERRIREEKESLQRQLIRQERLAAIGVLVSGVAHELNNPLQAILGFAELLQMQEDLPEAVQRDLSLIRRESTRASAIIRNLQRFGRQTTEPSPVKLSDVVASVLELRQRKIEAQSIRLDIEDQSEAVVSAVFTELQQVVLNFVINAEQAVARHDPTRRRIKIRTSDARNSARLEVEDYGDGVQPDDEPKLFQPFFTTKPVGEGTGLGLSVSYGIITSHGGDIGYRRSHHGGALFYFELPTK